MLEGEEMRVNVVNRALDLDEVQGSMEEVTRHKTLQAADIVQGPVFVEDTCLGFDALGGLPGAYIKWFVQGCGLDGLVKMLAGFEDKTAHAITTFGYCEGPGHEVVLFTGDTKGTIVDSRGPTTFGWDAVFQPDGFETTYAEMAGDAKNKISHRSKAMKKLKEFLSQL